MPKVKILVVEDDKILAMGLEKKLKDSGFAITGIASSGAEAIDSVKEIQPDLVLMDIVLKGAMDGIETAKFIISLYDIPIIYLTAYADDEILERAEKTCPYGYILKPYKDNELIANIKMAIYKHNLNKEEVVDFEDVYRDVTQFIEEKEDSFREGIIDESISGPFNIDIGLKNIYISIDRNNKNSYKAFYKLLSDIIARYVMYEENKVIVYPRGDELCLEFAKTEIDS
jgi:CheY-like chemotaxis protein